MMVFGAAYAGAYDALYGEKDYVAECDMIESLAREFGSNGKISTLADFGCGTGNHAIPLARRGYRVAGLDLSPDMLEQARAKSTAAGVAERVSFTLGNVQDTALPGAPFGAAIMMFAVLGYQRSDQEVVAALANVRRQLPRGAPFVFDVWYGPAVIQDRPGARERHVDEPSGKLVRRTHASLDEAQNLCTVQFELERLKDGKSAQIVREDHVMRYFFPQELDDFAAKAGFAPVALRDFSDYRKAATSSSWNVTGVFRAI
jgi:SAM-dependent methyltransferase